MKTVADYLDGSLNIDGLCEDTLRMLMGKSIPQFCQVVGTMRGANTITPIRAKTALYVCEYLAKQRVVTLGNDRNGNGGLPSVFPANGLVINVNQSIQPNQQRPNVIRVEKKTPTVETTSQVVVTADDDVKQPAPKTLAEMSLVDPSKYSYTISLDQPIHTLEVGKDDFEATVALKYLQMKISASHRGIEFDLKLRDIARLLKKKRCHYSGKAFDTNLNTLSIDRVDNTRGYVPDNVVACARQINHLKGYLLEGKTLVKDLSPAEIKRTLTSFLKVV